LSPSTCQVLLKSAIVHESNPPEPTPNNIPHPNSEPIDIDKAKNGKTLRRRNEKVPKHLKRKPNQKEMDGFTKRVLRIPLGIPFEEAYFTHILWMIFRETRETEDDIRTMFHLVKERMKNM